MTQSVLNASILILYFAIVGIRNQTGMSSMKKPNTQEFSIVEVEGNDIYLVKWGDSTKESSAFCFYVDAYQQYEHIRKLGKEAELTLMLLPLPNNNIKD